MTSSFREKFVAKGKEWLDTLVVSISVAMAFRAYFYQPFNIPTGSMQPTLYGNHSVAAKPAEKTVWDSPFLSKVKWAVTGETFADFRAPAAGRLWVEPTNTGYYRVGVDTAAQTFMIPADAFEPGTPRLKSGLGYGDTVRAGQPIWCGRIVSGDYLFVNRWLWNFRKPRRGDVMIFSTTGIDGLPQGTHYIKRMTGLPGETVAMGNGFFSVDGNRMESVKPADCPPYSNLGRGVAQRLGLDEYYACGDNSPSSYDSRYWGPVPGRCLRGVAGGVFWPFWNRRWGFVK